MKRLFVAVDLEAASRGAIARISEAARVRLERDGAARMTWVHPDRLHLTLHFLGYADERMEERARAAVAKAIPMTPFDLAFAGLGVFPRTGPPRVLWLGVAGGLADLERLHDIIGVRLGSADAAKERFSPHLTLARFRSRVSRAALLTLAEIPATAGPSRIDRVTLYESRLSGSDPRVPRAGRGAGSGPTYLPIADAPLVS